MGNAVGPVTDDAEDPSSMGALEASREEGGSGCRFSVDKDRAALRAHDGEGEIQPPLQPVVELEGSGQRLWHREGNGSTQGQLVRLAMNQFKCVEARKRRLLKN